MSLRKIAITGFVWTFAQQFGNQSISFIVSVILARLLLPEEFGLIGMIAIFIAVGNTLLNSGLTQSLIRTPETDDEDYSTIFYFNLLISCFLYGVMYFLAPFIANFFDQLILIKILRIYCFTFIISAFGAVQLAILTKEMNFRKQTVIAIPAGVIGGISGIALALFDFGVWSLVWSSIITITFNTIFLWISAQWRPTSVLNFSKFKNHFNFGYKLTLAGLMDQIFNNLFLLVIGKFFSPAQVGFYTRAETMKQLPVNNISNALNKVTYPLFATIQKDNVSLKRVYKKIMTGVLFVVAPTLVLLGVLAEPIFRFLLTEKWLPAVPYFQILCITGILYPIHSYNLNVLKVKGRSDLLLKLAIIKKTFILVGILIGLQFGIYGLLYAQVFLSIIAYGINTIYTEKFIQYSRWEQIKDILPILILSSITGAFVWAIDLKSNLHSDILRIFIGSVAGLAIYWLLSFLFKIQSLKYLYNFIRRSNK